MPPPEMDTTSRKVVVLEADAASQTMLRAWAEAQGFDLGASFGGEPRDPANFKFHLTLFATAGSSPLAELETEIEPITVRVAGFDALGPDGLTPVLAIAPSAALGDMRAVWLDMSGAEPTYAEFKPHITLSYAWDGTPALEDLPMLNAAITLDRLAVRTLDDKPERAEKGSCVLSFKSEAAGSMTAEQLAAKLPEYRAAVEAWEKEVEAEWNFDFSEFGETVDEIQSELAACEEAASECEALATFGLSAEAVINASRDSIESLLSDYEDLASTAALAEEACAMARSQLGHRLASFSSDAKSTRRPRSAVKSDTASLELNVEIDGGKITDLLLQAGEAAAHIAALGPELANQQSIFDATWPLAVQLQDDLVARVEQLIADRQIDPSYARLVRRWFEEVVADLPALKHVSAKSARRPHGRKATYPMSLNTLLTEISEWRDELDGVADTFDMSSVRYGAWLKDTIDKLEDMRASEITDGGDEDVADAMEDLDQLIADFKAALASYYANRKSTRRPRGRKASYHIDLAIEPEIRAAFAGNAVAEELLAEHDLLNARYLELQDSDEDRTEAGEVLDRMDEIEAELARMIRAAA